MTGKLRWEFGKYKFTLFPVTSEAVGWVVTNDEFEYTEDTVGAEVILGSDGLVWSPERLCRRYLWYEHDCNVEVIDSTKSRNEDRNSVLLDVDTDFREWIGQRIKQKPTTHEVWDFIEVDRSADTDTLAQEALDRSGMNGTPDLLIYDVMSKSVEKDPLYQFVEIKGPDDCVRENQKRWFRIFDDIFPVYVMCFEQVEKYDQPW